MIRLKSERPFAGKSLSEETLQIKRNRTKEVSEELISITSKKNIIKVRNIVSIVAKCPRVNEFLYNVRYNINAINENSRKI